MSETVYLNRLQLCLWVLLLAEKFKYAPGRLIRGSTVIDDCKTNQWLRSTRLNLSWDRGSDKWSPGPDPPYQVLLRKNCEGYDTKVYAGYVRAILCKNQGKYSGKWKILTPPPHKILYAIRYYGGMSKKCTLFEVLLYCCHGNTNCLLVAKNLIFNSETVVKSVKCVSSVSQVH